MLEAALAKLPHVAAQLDRAMQTSRKMAPVLKQHKRLCAFSLIGLGAAKLRAGVGAHALVTGLTSWVESIFFLSVGMRRVGLSAVQSALHTNVAYTAVWPWLGVLAGIITLTYKYWWPGQVIDAADDNYQDEHAVAAGLQRWGRSHNNAGTNPLQQCHFSVGYPRRLFWLPANGLHSLLGLRKKSVRDVRRHDYAILPEGHVDASRQPFFGTVLRELEMRRPKSRGRHFLLRQLHERHWKHDRTKYPKAKFGDPGQDEFFPDVDHGGWLLPLKRWLKSDVRVLQLQMLNTQKVEQVGDARTKMLNWFGRRNMVIVGDWGLDRAAMAAAPLSREDARLRRLRTSGGAAVATDAATMLVEQTALALSTFLATTPALGQMRKVASEWGWGGAKSKERIRAARQKAGIKGEGPLYRITGEHARSDLTALLQYTLSSSAAAAAAAAAPAAAASPAAPAAATTPPPAATPTVGAAAAGGGVLGPEAWPAMLHTQLQEQLKLRETHHCGVKADLLLRLKHFCPPGTRCLEYSGTMIECPECSIWWHHRCLERDYPAAPPPPTDEEDDWRCPPCEYEAAEAAAATTEAEAEAEAAAALASAATALASAAVALTPTTATSPAAAAAPTAAPPATAAAQAAAAGPRASSADTNFDQLVRGIDRQGLLQQDPAVPALDFDPLSSAAKRILDTPVGILRSALHLYDGELGAARSDMSASQRLRFTERWYTCVQQRLEMQQQECGPIPMAVLGQQLQRARNAEVAHMVQQLEARLQEMRVRKSERDSAAAQLTQEAAAATAVARGAIADATSEQSAADKAAVAQTAAREEERKRLAFPDLKDVYAAPGFGHLGEFGGLKAVHKIYFQPLIAFCAHNCLHRQAVDATVRNYQSCKCVFFAIYLALFKLMIDAFSASAFYVASCDEGPDAYADCFLEWHESNLLSADVPYIFYSGFVMGPGFAYRSMIIAVHEFDSPTMYALLLVYMGLFRATGRINLAKQCFLALLRLICWPLEIVQAMLSGACQILRDFAKGHAVSTDLCLEAAQGNVKLGQGKRFNVTSAKIHSSLNFFFRRVREHHEVLHVPSEPDASTSRSEKYKGRKVRSQGADVELIVQQLKQFHLFDHHGPPRASLSELPAGLVPKNFNLPPAHVHLVDFSRSLNSLETPILKFALAAVDDYFTKSPLLQDDSATTEVAQGAAPLNLTWTDCRTCAQIALSGSACAVCRAAVCSNCRLGQSGGWLCPICYDEDGEITEEEAAAAEANAELDPHC